MKFHNKILYLSICLVFFLALGQVLRKMNILESFRSAIPNPNPKNSPTPMNSYNVDLPINTTVSCQNFCGPPAKCSMTGEQCLADSDCQGCQVQNDLVSSSSSAVVRGQNDAGILTGGVTPTYSSLTTDIGSRAAFYNPEKGENLEPPQYFQGVNQWSQTFNIGSQLYDERYNPSIKYQIFLPKYPTRKTLSGEFQDDGPLAANDFL